MFHPTGKKGVITSGYLPSNRKDHYGIDIGLPVGSPVYAWKSGTVTIAVKGCVVGDLNCGNKGGNYVNIEHSGGITSQYLHLSSNVVRAGQKVKEGQLIGYIGNTGYSSGPHLHFALIRNGSFIDPTPYLKASGTKKKNENENELPLILATLFLFL